MIRWGMDLGKRVFVIALTCEAENLGKDVQWLDGVVGGLIWASSHNRTASLKEFSAVDPDGNVVKTVYDTFARSIFELFYCIHGLVEFEYNITFDGFWRRVQAAHSIATGGSSSTGFKPYFNGKNIPLRFLDWHQRQMLLKTGFIAQEGVYDASGKLVLVPRKVNPRPFELKTCITTTIEKQIALRRLFRPLLPLAAPSAAGHAQPADPKDSPTRGSLGDSEDQTKKDADAYTAEREKVKLFNAQHKSTMRPNTCKTCPRRLVSFKSVSRFQAHYEEFAAMQLEHFSLIGSASGSCCNSEQCRALQGKK